jgi:hypothetical protein
LSLLTSSFQAQVRKHAAFCGPTLGLSLWHVPLKNILTYILISISVKILRSKYYQLVTKLMTLFQ